MSNSVTNKPIELIPVEQLMLDDRNPRFAHLVSAMPTQAEILNLIVKEFGIKDVISSIAVSGYFSAEPLVCRKRADGTYQVAEGNRRLAAILTLLGEDRASEQVNLHNKFSPIYEEHGSPDLGQIPCIVFDESDREESLISYLGVRHIVATKEWDSYAKAAWISRALEENPDTLTLDDLSRMIGDTRGTLNHMLNGYHVMKQLESAGHFHPEQSVRKGRGSNPYYPFSWVYTALNYNSIKNFVELDTTPDNPQPIPEEKLDNAGLLIQAMFGDSRSGRNPAIRESRAIGKLAKVVAFPEQVFLLREGKDVDEIERLSQPLSEQLGDTLSGIYTQLKEINGRLGDSDLTKEATEPLLSVSESIKKQSAALHRNLLLIDDDDES